MRPTTCLVLLTALATGCRVCDNAWRTLVTEPSRYCERADRRESCERSQELAEAAWGELVWNMPERSFSPDYAAGFKHGYAAYLHAGGRALPPPLPLPPRKYWNIEYTTPEGQQAAREWLAGARMGIESAQHSGIRELVVVPSSACGVAYGPPGFAVPGGGPIEPGGGPIEVHPGQPVIPEIPPAPAPAPEAGSDGAPAAGSAAPPGEADWRLPDLPESVPEGEADAVAPPQARRSSARTNRC